MIILLALLNDIPILSIAYDNTKIRKKPVRWDMKGMLVLSTWLGTAGVLSSFTIFYITMVYVYHHPVNPFTPAIPKWVDIHDYKTWLAFVQSAFFTKLIMAGHWTIFNTRTAEFGLITPIGWKWGLFLFVYTVVWFLFNDVVKRAVVKYYQKERGEEII